MWAQQGQTNGRPGWPCVPGRAVDPSYLDVSESTGGQLFLFQPGETEHASAVMSASFTHPATVVRAVGHLSGSREIEFPVDSKTTSILVMASLQCRAAIIVTRPNGAELVATNSARDINLKSGRILQIDLPEAGKWKVRLLGTGLYVLSVAAKTEIGIKDISFPQLDQWEQTLTAGVRQAFEAHIAGEIWNVRFHLAGPEGEFIASLESEEAGERGVYHVPLPPSAGRFRIVVTGSDATAYPFQRTYPNLLKPQRLN